MTDKKQDGQIEQEEQNEREELRDLNMPEKDAEDVKGGSVPLEQVAFNYSR